MKEAMKKLKELIKKYGYWSEEVKEFNSSLPIDMMRKINDNINHTNKK